jgi:threonine/homoserine/homoserine lactone efflux protein
MKKQTKREIYLWNASLLISISFAILLVVAGISEIAASTEFSRVVLGILLILIGALYLMYLTKKSNLRGKHLGEKEDEQKICKGKKKRI